MAREPIVVRISNPITYEGRSYGVGQVVEMPEALAQRFIGAGYAVKDTIAKPGKPPRPVEPWSGDTAREANVHGIKNTQALVKRQSGDRIRGGRGVNLLGPAAPEETPPVGVVDWFTAGGDTEDHTVPGLGVIRRLGRDVWLILTGAVTTGVPLGFRPHRDLTLAGAFQNGTAIASVVRADGTITTPGTVGTLHWFAATALAWPEGLPPTQPVRG